MQVSLRLLLSANHNGRSTDKCPEVNGACQVILNFSQTKVSDRATDRARVRKRAFTYESASSSSCSSSSSKRQCSRQLTKSTFQKWQISYEKEHQTLTWLKCELDHYKVSVVSLSCTVCKKYESKICSLKSFTNAWITNLKSTNVLDHANSAVHKAAMGHMRELML